jgi:hypothetical protein
MEGKNRFILIDVHDTIHKPAVAKIFEHKHVFYNEVPADLARSAGTSGSSGRQPFVSLSPKLTLLPSRRTEPVSKHGPTPFELQRSQVVVPYFLQPYQQAA